MRRRSTGPIALLACVGLSPLACTPRETTTPSGVIVRWLDSGRGPEIAPEDWVLVHYDAWIPGGDWVDTTHDDGVPFLAPSSAEGLLVAGLDEALRLLRVGDRAAITLPAATAYSDVGKPPRVPPNSDLIYELEVLQRLETRENGLRIAVREEGSGEPASDGDWVVVDYTATHPRTGRELAATPRNQPLEFQLGASNMLPGLNAGIRGLRPGAKATLVLPPELAYGERGKPPWIAPGVHLIYELELRGVRER